MASVILFLIIVLAFALIARKKNTGPISEVIVGIAVLGLCVAMGWFPVWLFVLTSLLLALLLSGKITNLIGGKS